MMESKLRSLEGDLGNKRTGEKTFPDGTVEFRGQDGKLETRVWANGIKEYFDLEGNRIIKRAFPNGITENFVKGKLREKIYPDGSKETYNPKGELVKLETLK